MKRLTKLEQYVRLLLAMHCGTAALFAFRFSLWAGWLITLIALYLLFSALFRTRPLVWVLDFKRRSATRLPLSQAKTRITPKLAD